MENKGLASTPPASEVGRTVYELQEKHRTTSSKSLHVFSSNILWLNDFPPSTNLFLNYLGNITNKIWIYLIVFRKNRLSLKHILNEANINYFSHEIYWDEYRLA